VEENAKAEEHWSSRWPSSKVTQTPSGGVRVLSGASWLVCSLTGVCGRCAYNWHWWGDGEIFITRIKLLVAIHSSDVEFVLCYVMPRFILEFIFCIYR
jgi:hypothetical protein